jgi:hypothetical protein
MTIHVFTGNATCKNTQKKYIYTRREVYCKCALNKEVSTLWSLSHDIRVAPGGRVDMHGSCMALVMLQV